MTTSDQEYVFLYSRRRGQYYRGARYWRWSRNWRRAAALPVYFWRAFILPKLDIGQEDDDWCFNTLSEACTWEDAGR